MSLTWWDGATIDEGEINLSYHDSKTVRIITREGEIHYGQIRPYHDNIPCLIDQIKPIFSLTPTGTKVIKRAKGKNLLLYRLKYYETNHNHIIMEDCDLKEFDNLTEDQKEIIRFYFVFREVVGLSINVNAVIKVRPLLRVKDDLIVKEKTPRLQILSYREDKIKLSATNVETVLPQTVIKEWFKNLNICDVVCHLTNYDRDEAKLAEKLSHYQEELEKTIHRIDRNLIWVSAHILKRLSHYYRLALTDKNSLE